MIRAGNINDLDRIYEIEVEGFPEGQAASKDTYEWRIKNLSECFFVLEIDNEIVSFIFGRNTEFDIFIDELYEKSIMKQGDYIGILTLATAKKDRKKGYAGLLLKYLIENFKISKKGLTLACMDNLISYYCKFGFNHVGISESTHGNVIWNDMRIDF